MVTKTVILNQKTGLHARPASALVAFAKELPCKVWIEKDGKKAAADSILQLLTLGAREGSSLTLSAEGQEGAAALDQVAAFLEKLEG